MTPGGAVSQLCGDGFDQDANLPTFWCFSVFLVSEDMLSRKLVRILSTKRAMSTKAPQKLSAEERSAALQTLPTWKLVDGRDAIFKQYKFANFVDAFGFMTKVAIEAEKVRISACFRPQSLLTQLFHLDGPSP
jgi:hypothetical protein